MQGMPLNNGMTLPEYECKQEGERERVYRANAVVRQETVTEAIQKHAQTKEGGGVG